MSGLFNIVSSIGAKRDEYGVEDLLNEVSKRSSSISADDRQEIADISKRLRQHRLGTLGSSHHTPRQTPDNSQHDVKSKDKKDYGKDLLKVDSLLRGFASSGSPTKPRDVPPISPVNLMMSDNNVRPTGTMLRDFASPRTQVTMSDVEIGACSFEQARHM